MKMVFKPLFICLMVVLTFVVSGCSDDKKFAFFKPVNTYLDKRKAEQQPTDGAAESVKANQQKNSHLNPQNSIYWQKEYYLGQPLPE